MSENNEVKPKKKRGRKPKVSNTSSDDKSVKVPKKRGRKPKVKTDEDAKPNEDAKPDEDAKEVVKEDAEPEASNTVKKIGSFIDSSGDKVANVTNTVGNVANSLQIAPVDFSGWLKPWIDIYKQFIQIISQSTNMDAKLTDALLNIDNNVKAFIASFAIPNKNATKSMAVSIPGEQQFTSLFNNIKELVENLEKAFKKIKDADHDFPGQPINGVLRKLSPMVEKNVNELSKRIIDITKPSKGAEGGGNRSFIIDPITKKSHSLNSLKGKNILSKYMENYNNAF